MQSQVLFTYISINVGLKPNLQIDQHIESRRMKLILNQRRDLNCKVLSLQLRSWHMWLLLQYLQSVTNTICESKIFFYKECTGC